MSIDIHAKAIELLERIANSVHERDPKNPNLLFFSAAEVLITEEWIRDLLESPKVETPTGFVHLQLNKEELHE